MFKLLFIAGLVYFFYRITTKKIDAPRDIYEDEDIIVFPVVLMST